MRNWKFTLIYVPYVTEIAREFRKENPFILAKLDYLNGPDNFIASEAMSAHEIGQELGGN